MLTEFTQTVLPSFCIAWLANWLLSKVGKRFKSKNIRWLRRLIENLSASAALALAAVWGSLSLQDAVGWPSKFWHWFGPISLLCLLVQLIKLTKKVSAPISLWSCAAWGICALVSAWLVVPTWSSLSPGRPWFVLGLAMYLASLALLYEYTLVSAVTRGANLEVSRQWVVVGAVTALVLAALIAVDASLKYAALTSVIGVGCIGILLGYGRQAVRDVSLLTVVPCLGFLLGTAAFVGMIYPQPPIYRLLLLPFAPLAIPVSLRFVSGSTQSDQRIRYGIAAATLIVFSLIAAF